MSTEYYTDTPTEQKERLMKIKSRKVRKAITLPDLGLSHQNQNEKFTTQCLSVMIPLPSSSVN